MEITARVGNLRVAASATVLIDKERPLVIQVGKINIRFELVEFNESECKVDRLAEESTLTLVHKITGKVPLAPFTFFSTAPQEVGKTGGVPIYFFWRLCRPHPDQQTVQIHYTVFTEEPKQPSLFEGL
jgi:hypothetical protein